MNTLTIFYDSSCGLCTKFRIWLEGQPKRVRIEFIDYQSPAAAERFPTLLAHDADREVVVLADDGRWWQGSAAWITCLWATDSYHHWAYRLANPALLPLVKKAVILLSENRLSLSRLMGFRADREIADEISSVSESCCESSNCVISTHDKP
jgi:predicted DCC family thiol-disulfide oxidoreductase YuxK